jgi:hypothetical protein
MMIEARALPSAAGDAEDAERLLESIQYPLIERLGMLLERIGVGAGTCCRTRARSVCDSLPSSTMSLRADNVLVDFFVLASCESCCCLSCCVRYFVSS